MLVLVLVLEEWRWCREILTRSIEWHYRHSPMTVRIEDEDDDENEHEYRLPLHPFRLSSWGLWEVTKVAQT